MPSLDFKGKSEIYSHHLTVPCYPLKIDSKKSFGFQNGTSQWTPSLNDNLIIHGDNLYALKSLLPQYAGRIKCIYIDPPYNTGNEKWKYNDNVNSPLMKTWLGQVVDLDDLEKHDKWLCMMWPRLQLLKELLAENGVIFVSIDDHEQCRLQMMMNEIFGEKNCITTLIKPTKIGGGNNSKHIVKSHEYILVYAQSKSQLMPLFVKHQKDYLKRYRERDKKGRFFWDTLNRPGLRNAHYSITAPDGTAIEGSWIWSKKRVEKAIQLGEIRIEKINRKWSVHFKQRLNIKGKKLTSLLSRELVGGTIEGSREMKDIFHNAYIFPYPKSSHLIKFLLESLNCQDAIVLDSFAGTGTTAHAVLQLNQEDGGQRKFILVECEDYAHTITAERVRKVIKGIPQSQNKKLQKKMKGSFTYCQLDFNT